MSEEQSAGGVTVPAPSDEGPKRRMLVTDAIATAGNLCNAGRLEQAEKLCRQILEKRPNVADAHNILGVILHRKGRTDEAVNEIRRAIKLFGNAPNFYSNLGEMERVRGNLDVAAAALSRAFNLTPQSAH